MKLQEIIQTKKEFYMKQLLQCDLYKGSEHYLEQLTFTELEKEYKEIKKG